MAAQLPFSSRIVHSPTLPKQTQPEEEEGGEWQDDDDAAEEEEEQEINDDGRAAAIKPRKTATFGGPGSRREEERECVCSIHTTTFRGIMMITLHFHCRSSFSLHLQQIVARIPRVLLIVTSRCCVRGCL